MKGYTDWFAAHGSIFDAYESGRDAWDWQQQKIEQLQAELDRMKIVERGSIEEIAHAGKTIEQQEAQKLDLLRDLSIAFSRVEELEGRVDELEAQYLKLLLPLPQPLGYET